MTTAREVVTEALEMSGAVPIGQTPDTIKNTRGLTYLNEMIAAWKNEGLDLQLDTMIATDTIYLDPSDIMCIKYNLTVLMYQKFKRPMDNGIIVMADNLYDSLNAKYMMNDMREMTLPAGLVRSTKSNINTGEC